MASIELLGSLISQNNIRVEAECKHDYFDLLHQGVTFKTIALTLLGIILTISIECTIHASSKPVTQPTTESQLPYNHSPDIDAATSNVTHPLTSGATQHAPSETSDAHPTVEQARSAKISTTTWCESHPSPSTRVRRLTRSTILLIPICLCFGLRMAHNSLTSRIRSECVHHLASSLRPDWLAITFLNIVPFIVAIFAWLRAFIDCLLVRWKKGLRYPTDDSPLLGWPPCAPLLFVIMVAAIPIFLFVSLMNKAAKRVAGEPSGNEDRELGEENRSLVAGVDVDDEDMEGPPAYDGLEGTRNKYLGVEYSPTTKESSCVRSELEASRSI